MIEPQQQEPTEHGELIKSVYDTREYQAALTAQALFEGFMNMYGEAAALSPQFKEALKIALTSVDKTPALKEKIVALKTKMDSRQFTSAADTNHDGQVSSEEAIARVKAIFIELGMPEQADLFEKRARNKKDAAVNPASEVVQIGDAS